MMMMTFEECRGQLTCGDGFCWQPMSLANGAITTNRFLCKSLCLMNQSVCSEAPVLQGADSAGIKVCHTDENCVYLVGKTMYRAKDFNKTCFCTSLAPTMSMHCQTGEGDPAYVATIKGFYT